MILLFISIAWFAFLVHFLWKIGKIYFAREFLEEKDGQGLSNIPSLTVIIPARNEEDTIEKCVFSLAVQSYPKDKYNIIVVDDNSTDRTASIVNKMMEEYDNIALIPAGDLPEGWSGKNNACWQGIKKAEGDWYCFIDADTTSEPELLVNAITFAQSKQIDMLSINPFQELLSCAERVFMPGVFLSIASTMNFPRVNDPASSESGANGQFMLFRSKAYDSIGGHMAVRAEIMEDMALGELVKKSGFRLYWVFGDRLIRTRMYKNLSHIWDGLSKNMIDITKDSGKISPVYRAFSSFLLGWMPLILPIIAWANIIVYGTSTLHLCILGLSIAASLSFLVFYLLTLISLNVPIRYIFSFPLGFTLHAALTLNSFRKIIQGKRHWKGRVYSYKKK